MSKGLLVKVAINNKEVEKTVTVMAKRDDKNFCCGKVGDYSYIWKCNKYSLPMLKLTQDQIKKLYQKCNTSEEKSIKLDTTRKQIKTFLLAYKALLAARKTIELHSPSPVLPNKDIPEGFELVSEDMFEVSES